MNFVARAADEPVLSLWSMFFASGEFAVYGWLSLVVLFVVGLLVRFRVLSRVSPRAFLACAHIQCLCFLLANGVQGLILSYGTCSWPPPHYLALSLTHMMVAVAINLIVVVLLVIFVSWGDRPRFEFMPGTGIHFGLLVADVALLLALQMSLVGDILVMRDRSMSDPHGGAAHRAINFDAATARLQRAVVHRDVRHALAMRDHRFLCVTGEGVYAPGLPESHFRSGISITEVDWSRYRVIDETGDELDPACADSMRRFKVAAEEYAERYNVLLLKQLQK